MVHDLIAWSQSKLPRMLSSPLKAGPYDKSKRYLMIAHPHGLLVCGWWNILARFGRGYGTVQNDPFDGLKVKMCFAPIVGKLPFHGHMCADVVEHIGMTFLAVLLSDEHWGGFDTAATFLVA